VLWGEKPGGRPPSPARSPPRAGRGGTSGGRPVLFCLGWKAGGVGSSAKVNLGRAPATDAPLPAGGTVSFGSTLVLASALSRAAFTRCAASFSAASLWARSLSASADCCGSGRACTARAGGAFGATLRGAMGAGLATGFGATPRLGAGLSDLNSSAILGMSLVPIPRRSRQLRLSVTEPFDESWSILQPFRFTSLRRALHRGFEGHLLKHSESRARRRAASSFS